MISTRLVHLIESNGETIVDRAVAQFRRDPEIGHNQSLLEYELRELGQGLTQHLGNWLSTGDGEDPAQRCEHLGKLCWDQKVPLEDAFHGLCLLRVKMLDFAQEHMISNSSIELYAEEELDRRLGRFFDRLATHLIRGFEQATQPRNARQTIH